MSWAAHRCEPDFRRWKGDVVQPVFYDNPDQIRLDITTKNFARKAAPPPQTRPSALGRQILAQGRACVVGVEQAARPVGRQRSAGL